MSDRCYLEKCRDRLYPEFELAGITKTHNNDGEQVFIFASAEDLLAKTPVFYNSEVKKRIDGLFRKVYKFAETHFGGDNLYLKYLKQNIQHIESLLAEGDVGSLSRLPPQNNGSKSLSNTH